MTPKEAFKGLCDLSRVDNEDFKMWVGLRHDVEQALTKLEELKRYPTSEEVCEALSEYLKEPIKYVRTSFVNERETAEVCGLFGLDNYDLVDFNTPLPPHLITLIGRFYEGLEK